MSDEVTEIVGGVDDLEDGQMKEVEVGGVKVLLLKSQGTYHAMGAKCSHYGAPLVNGVFCGGLVRCPWHGACFSVKSGDIEDFPGLDSVPKFNVEVVDGKLQVRARRSALEKTKRVRPMAAYSPAVKTNVLIIGGGPAAAVCAETLRQEGFRGPIVVATKEKYLPYDRPKLSKVLNMSAEQISLRDPAYYRENTIEFMFDKEAECVNFEKKRVKFKNAEECVRYDKLVLATGTYARTLSMVPGYDLENVTTLRSLDDAQSIALKAAEKDVVIVGTSFIGVEVAASLVGKAKTVTVVDLVEAPFQLALGKEVGNAVRKLLAEKGIQFHFQTTAKEFVGENGKLKQVVLKDGTVLPAEFCVIGVGVAPATDFLKGSDLEMSERGFVIVNKQMETNIDSVYAIGDIAQFPLFIADNASVNIQHWQMAHQHGRICALNIADKKTSIQSVPFFWTALFGKSLRYTGYGVGYDDVIIHGSLDDLKFAAFYTKQDKVVAVASMNMDPVVAQAAQMMLHNQVISKHEVKSDPLAWTSRLKSL